MTPQQYLPTVMMVLSVLAAIVYATYGDVKHSIYWMSSATIIWSVTY